MQTIPLRTCADLARILDIGRARLHQYVKRANVRPVRIEGRKRLYGRDEQACIVYEFYLAWLEVERLAGHSYERHRWPLLTELMAELDLEEFVGRG